MIADTFNGLLAFFRALPYMSKGRLGLLAMAPGAVGAALSAIYVFTVFKASDDIADWLMNLYPWEVGASTTAFVSQWLTVIVLVVLYFLLFKYIILIIGGPFMSPFSERIEQLITGQEPKAKFAPAQFIADLYRAIRLNVRNLLLEVLFTLGLLLLSMIPVLAPFTSIGLFLLGAYYAGFGNLDFTMERHLNYKGSIAFVQQNKGIALGNGIGFMILFAIPIIGVFLALPLATAAGTLTTVKRLQKQNVV